MKPQPLQPRGDTADAQAPGELRRGYKSYTEQYLDSTGIFKEAVISILAIVAKQERVRLSERTRTGIECARGKDMQLGKPGFSQEQVDQVRRLKGTSLSNYAISSAINISKSTVAKHVSINE